MRLHRFNSVGRFSFERPHVLGVGRHLQPGLGRIAHAFYHSLSPSLELAMSKCLVQ